MDDGRPRVMTIDEIEKQLKSFEERDEDIDEDEEEAPESPPLGSQSMPANQSVFPPPTMSISNTNVIKQHMQSMSKNQAKQNQIQQHEQDDDEQNSLGYMGFFLVCFVCLLFVVCCL